MIVKISREAKDRKKMEKNSLNGKFVAVTWKVDGAIFWYLTK